MADSFEVGQTYPQDGCTLRILAKHLEKVLLEKWHEDSVLQYIVTDSLYIHNGELHWHGSGAYFCPRISGRTPFEELSRAMEYMRGPRTVYVVMSDTEYGMSVSINFTMQEAKACLQGLLDGNDDIQYAAKASDIDHLTAEAYLDGALSDAPLLTDWYYIVVEEVRLWECEA